MSIKSGKPHHKQDAVRKEARKQLLSVSALSLLLIGACILCQFWGWLAAATGQAMILAIIVWKAKCQLPISLAMGFIFVGFLLPLDLWLAVHGIGFEDTPLGWFFIALAAAVVIHAVFLQTAIGKSALAFAWMTVIVILLMTVVVYYGKNFLFPVAGYHLQQGLEFDPHLP